MIPGSSPFCRTSVCALLCALLAFPPALLAPPAPGWWTARGAIDPTKLKDDHAAANLGQLKHFAAKAYVEFEAKLPGGAGADLDALVGSWFLPPAPGVTRDDQAALTLGQLKRVGKLFYDRLAAKGLPTAHPWTATTTDDDDLAIANLGQMKQVFSFTIPGEPDLDGDGLPDSWELQYFGNLAHTRNADDDGDGLTNKQEHTAGSNPTKADSDDDGVSDPTEIAAHTSPSDPRPKLSLLDPSWVVLTP